MCLLVARVIEVIFALIVKIMVKPYKESLIKGTKYPESTFTYLLRLEKGLLELDRYSFKVSIF